MTLETLRKKLALNNCLSCYLKREKQFKQNKDFLDKPFKLYEKYEEIGLPSNHHLKKKLSNSGNHF